MGQAVDQAQKQRELSKEALAADLERFEAKVRSELDVRARLRRDGLRLLALGGAAVVLVGGLLILRARLRRGSEEEPESPASLEDVAEELREIRRELEKQRKNSGASAQKLLVRGLAAAGSAGGTYFARQMLKRQQAARKQGDEQASAG